MRYFFVQLWDGYNVIKVVGGSPTVGGAKSAALRHAALVYKRMRVVWRVDELTKDLIGNIVGNGDGLSYRIYEGFPLFE